MSSDTDCRYEDNFFESLCERLDDVVAMRETHAELLELLVMDSLDHVVRGLQQPVPCRIVLP